MPVSVFRIYRAEIKAKIILINVRGINFELRFSGKHIAHIPFAGV
jgi:hypothetical protein